MQLFGSREKRTFANRYMRQLGALVNIATTGHKLQGMSMDYIIVVSWFYTVKNWVYVVLSRVRKLSGLFLFKPLDFNKHYKEDIKLKVHMKELEEKEKITLSSVKKIPKMSYALKKNSTHKSKTISNSMLSNPNLKIFMTKT